MRVMTEPPTPEAALALYRREVEAATDTLAPVLWVAVDPDGPAEPMTLSQAESPTTTLLVLAHGVAEGTLDPAAWVLFAAEAWTARGDHATAATVEPGELAERRAIGMTGVGEALVLTYADGDGGLWVVEAAFERRAALGGAVVWGKVQTAVGGRDAFDGAIPSALSAIVGRRVNATDQGVRP